MVSKVLWLLTVSKRRLPLKILHLPDGSLAAVNDICYLFFITFNSHFHTISNIRICRWVERDASLG